MAVVYPRSAGECVVETQAGEAMNSIPVTPDMESMTSILRSNGGR